MADQISRAALHAAAAGIAEALQNKSTVVTPGRGYGASASEIYEAATAILAHSGHSESVLVSVIGSQVHFMSDAVPRLAVVELLRRMDAAEASGDIDGAAELREMLVEIGYLSPDAMPPH